MGPNVKGGLGTGSLSVGYEIVWIAGVAEPCHCTTAKEMSKHWEALMLCEG